MKSSLMAVAVLMLVANVAKAQNAAPVLPGPEFVAAANVKAVPCGS